MKTKTFIALALIISSISFCSCGSYMTGKSAIMKVEKGMAKKEVVSLLGEPDFRRFDEQVEEWEYKKTNHYSQFYQRKGEQYELIRR